MAEPGLNPSDPKHQAFWSSQHGRRPALSYIRTELTSTNRATGRHKILEPEQVQKGSPVQEAQCRRPSSRPHGGREGPPQLQGQNDGISYQLGWGQGVEGVSTSIWLTKHCWRTWVRCTLEHRIIGMRELHRSDYLAIQSVVWDPRHHLGAR